MKYHSYILTAILACGVGVIHSGIFSTEIQHKKTDHAEQSAKIGGSYSLTDHRGVSRSDRDFHGKFQLIYFGYTFCPDVCPTALLKIGSSLNEIEQKYPQKIDLLQPIFVTLDPERDTQSILGQYVSFFYPTLVGLTGSQEQINDIAKKFAVYFKRENESSDGSYLLDHSSVIYVMSQDGQYLHHFTHDTSQADMVGVLIDLISDDFNKSASLDIPRGANYFF